jgi:precorrin-6A/cobalt-precorrin-6A reductase
VTAIWLIGGTQESAQIAHELVKLGMHCVVTVTTATARNLYPQNFQFLRVWVGRLTSETIQPFLTQAKISAVLDASHPFATAITELAIATAQQHQLPYLRYERPPVASTDGPGPSTAETADPQAPVIWVDNYADLFKRNLLTQQRVLLTLGYRALPQFQPWHSQATLFARILPSPIALETALSAGFSPNG